jgi:hypothetical protein
VNTVTGDKVTKPRNPSDSWFEGNKLLWDQTGFRRAMVDYTSQPLFVAGITANTENFLDLFDLTVLLTADNLPEITRRLRHRTNNDFGKAESEIRLVLSFCRNYEARLMNLGAIPVSASTPTNQKADKLMGLAYGE